MSATGNRQCAGYSAVIATWWERRARRERARMRLRVRRRRRALAWCCEVLAVGCLLAGVKAALLYDQLAGAPGVVLAFGLLVVGDVVRRGPS